jgi:membrane AbrB-like protein
MSRQSGAHLTRSSAGLIASLTLIAVCVLVGVPAARLVRMPTAFLLGPMVIAAVLSAFGWAWSLTVARPIEDLAFGIIGLQVGLRFTPATVRRLGSLLPIALVMIFAMIALCAAVGVALGSLAHVSKLDAYLATTPGGLYAVLALALGSATSLGFIVAVQVLRQFVMLLVAPLIARRVISLHSNSGLPFLFSRHWQADEIRGDPNELA